MNIVFRKKIFTSYVFSFIWAKGIVKAIVKHGSSFTSLLSDLSLNGEHLFGFGTSSDIDFSFKKCHASFPPSASFLGSDDAVNYIMFKNYHHCHLAQCREMLLYFVKRQILLQFSFRSYSPLINEKFLTNNTNKTHTILNVCLSSQKYLILEGSHIKNVFVCTSQNRTG